MTQLTCDALNLWWSARSLLGADRCAPWVCARLPCVLHLAAGHGETHLYGLDPRARGGALSPPEFINVGEGRSVVARRRNVSIRDKKAGLTIDASTITDAEQGSFRVKFSSNSNRQRSSRSESGARTSKGTSDSNRLTTNRRNSSRSRRRKANGDQRKHASSSGKSKLSIELKRNEKHDTLSIDANNDVGMSGRLKVEGGEKFVTSGALPSGLGSIKVDYKRRGSRTIFFESPFCSLRLKAKPKSSRDVKGPWTFAVTPTFRWSVPFKRGGEGMTLGSFETTISPDGAHRFRVNGGGSCPVTLHGTLTTRSERQRFPTLRIRTDAPNGAGAEISYAGALRAHIEGTGVFPLPFRWRKTHHPGSESESYSAGDDSAHTVAVTVSLGSLSTDDAERRNAQVSVAATTSLGVATAHASVGGSCGIELEVPLRSGFLAVDLLSTPGATWPSCRVRAGVYR